VVLIASGSEVAIALETAAKLEAEGIGADVVSMPCWELFDAQDAAYRADILPAAVLKVSIEAGSTFGWERYTGLEGLRFGIDRYGASAPAEKLYEYFGLTADAIAPEVRAHLDVR
jgi:transketolase